MSATILNCGDYEAVSQRAADRIRVGLARKPNLLLCAAGGSSPARTYGLLAEHRRHDRAPFASLRLMQLDEWGGLPWDDPATCEAQLRNALVVPLGVPAHRWFGFRSDSSDPAGDCELMRKHLALEGPIDLCVLGLGLNGHLGMNEPAPALEPFAHVAELSEETLRHPMLAKASTRPEYGLTLGMAEILAAREILLLVSGAGKRAALQRLMQCEVTTAFPASFLWLHPNWTLLCDAAASEGL